MGVKKMVHMIKLLTLLVMFGLNGVQHLDFDIDLKDIKSNDLKQEERLAKSFHSKGIVFKQRNTYKCPKFFKNPKNMCFSILFGDPCSPRTHLKSPFLLMFES